MEVVAAGTPSWIPPSRGRSSGQHVGHLFTKLQLRDRVQAGVFAHDTGMVSAGGGD